MRVLIAVIIILSVAGAGAENAWVLCNPQTHVNVRTRPNTHAVIVANVFAGDSIELTGRRSGKWRECVVPCEAGGGWIRSDFLSADPVDVYAEGMRYKTTAGKVIARLSIKGKKHGELEKGRSVMVYAMSPDWAFTSAGYVDMNYLEAVDE